ncbi:PRC-barrel domain-containing protein [Roseibium aestuarii]|uniref:PRC-barrel domain-containing protein n=1 Tax=Roseibium aestuarii TaxID=2600299 RepID=A0ABW4JWF0_9HYPH|nr:PRC-barrel domain-containing protein [Roseibium aestuarii]
MLRKILTTTALVTALSVPAFAADTTDTKKPMDAQAPAAQTETMAGAKKDPSLYVFEVRTLAQEATRGYLASNLIGKYVYASAAEDADSIGDINDIVIGEDGTIQAVILGAGGFLGVGEKDVALDFNRLAMHETGDNEFRVTSDVTKEELEGAAEYSRPDYVPEWMSLSAIKDGAKETYDSAAKSTAEAYESAKASMTETGEKVEGEMDKTAAAVDANVNGNPDASAEAEWMKDKVAVETGTLEADELIGATVYDVTYDSVGEVGDVILTADGQIEAAVVDAGGFLGIGEKEVSIDFSKVTIFREADGDDLYVKTMLTEEELNNAPEYVEPENK